MCALAVGRSGWAIPVNAGTLSLQSGSVSAANVILSHDGYAGTYISAPGGPVTITLTATPTAGGGPAPHLNIVVADTKVGCDLAAAGSNSCVATIPNLPAGNYFVRNEYTNDGTDATNARSVALNTFDVSGATISTTNASTTSALNAAALAAADDYIKNFRRGPAALTLGNVTPGSQAHVQLTSHAFNFGVNVPGSSASAQATYLGAPTPGSNAESFQQFLKSHYINTLVPSNYGKWANTEATQNSPDMSNVDSLVSFAQANNMRVRMHALMWGDQNPSWVLTKATNSAGTGVLAQAMPTTITGGGGNTAPYLAAINNRINYYVGTGTPTDRSINYTELDVHNEEVHQRGPQLALGVGGDADIFKTVKDRVAAAGANTRLYVNEYNVLQNSPASIAAPPSGSSNYPYVGNDTGSDQYANWYRQNIDDIQNAAIDKGYGPVISGVGSQYYAIPVSNNTAAPAASTVAKALENLSVTGLPMSLTEFGIQPASTTVQANQAVAADTMEQAMRMVFGNPDADTFMYWGFWAGATSNLQSGGTLVGTAQPNGTAIDSAWKKADGSWNLTPAGQRYEWLFGINPDATKGGTNAAPWTTDVTVPVGADGTVNLTGFYGDYTVTVDGKTVPLSLLKGTSAYSLAIPVGDYNSDGVVNAADYTIWRSTLGSTTDLRADGNGNGVIDSADYATWVSNFGNVYSGGSGAAAAVPEPTSCMLLAAGSLALALYRRRARTSHSR
jgi:GH35 family endo-1,4-beta-xylanase